MEKLIDTVARALCLANGHAECVLRRGCTAISCTHAHQFRDDARAALAAIEASGTHAVVPVYEAALAARPRITP